MVNFSDTTPAPPTGKTNIKWQLDMTGNISGYTSLGSITKLSVTPSAGVLALDASLANSFRIFVNQAITSVTIANPSDGQEITLLWVQDGTGHAITLPTVLKGATAPSTGANLTSCQKFTYDFTANAWYAVAAGVTGM